MSTVESNKKFYEKQSSTFQRYMKNTDQKEILVKNIISKVSSSLKLSKNKEFIFTDIGAGDGKITIPVVNFLKATTKLTCEVIEPSELIDKFKENCNFEGIDYYKNKIEDIEIPKSDFILVSHVLSYFDDYKKTIKNICNSLKKGGIALFVETDSKSDEVLLKIKLEKLGQEFASLRNLDLIERIINFLEINKIKYQHEIISSEINTSGCLSLNKNGKSIISFFYHEPFDDLTPKDLQNFQEVIKESANNDNKLTKREDYVWIFN